MSAESHAFGDKVAGAVEMRIRKIVAYVAAHPEAAARVIERPGMHVVPLIRYPYKIFYRVFEDKVRILHVRRTSRRPWTKKR